MTVVIAHRGASAARAENTVEAFLEARRLGADMVELDVRRTADGALAVRHDATLPDGRRLVDVPVAELPPWLPLLDAAIDACEGMDVNVEIKNSPVDADFDPDHVLAARVIELVVERGLQARVIVSSFNLATIDSLRSADPTVATALLTVPAMDQWRALQTVVESGHVALHPHESAVTAELVAAAHAMGVALNAWTTDDPVRIRQLAAMDVDGIVTNVPDVARRALSAGAV